MTIFTLVGEGLDLYKLRERYFGDFWNFVDLASVVIYFICCTLWLTLFSVALTTEVPAAFDLTTSEDQMKLVELSVTLDEAVAYVDQVRRKFSKLPYACVCGVHKCDCPCVYSPMCRPVVHRVDHHQHHGLLPTMLQVLRRPGPADASQPGGPRALYSRAHILVEERWRSLTLPLYCLVQTLAGAAVDIIHFLFTFFVAFFCFALTATVMFGLKMQAFHTIAQSSHSLFAIANGDYTHLEQMRKLYPGGMGALYQYVFIFFMGYVMVNVFLAIIMDAYGQVMGDARTTGAATIMDDVARARAVLFRHGLSKKCGTS